MLIVLEDHQLSTVCVLPMYHIYAFNGILTTSLGHGDRVVSLPKFMPDTYIDAIKQHKVQLTVKL